MSPVGLLLILSVLFVSLMFFLPLPRWGRARTRGHSRRAGPVARRKGVKPDSRTRPSSDPGGRDRSRETSDQAGVPESKVPEHDPLEPLFVAQLRYEGGDWPANPEALQRLCKFYATECEPREYRVELGLRGRTLPASRPDFVFATGHHGFTLAAPDRQGLLDYLSSGGVVLIEDNNGMDFAFRRFLGETWPHHRLEAVQGGALFEGPFALSFYPKSRRHQGRPAALFRIRLDERDLDFYYSFSSDLGDGWQSNPHLQVAPDKRRLSLEMGSNFLAYALGRSS